MRSENKKRSCCCAQYNALCALHKPICVALLGQGSHVGPDGFNISKASLLAGRGAAAIIFFIEVPEPVVGDGDLLPAGGESPPRKPERGLTAPVEDPTVGDIVSCLFRHRFSLAIYRGSVTALAWVKQSRK